MITPTERILSALADRDCDPKQNGKGWIARCPAHDDRRPSLSVSQGDDGRTLIHCHAGCTTDAICESIGLRKADLMTDEPSTFTQSRKLPKKKQFRRRDDSKKAEFETANAAVDALERKHGKRSNDWTYFDAQGYPVCVIVRWDNAQGKDIRPVTRHGDKWTIGGMPEPRPLYCLPDLANADRVFICEGEKAADAARAIGLTATTSAHGSNSPDKSDWSPLAGKECVILPDNDEPGTKYAETATSILSKLTPAPTIKVIKLPNLPNHGDMADWVETRTNADIGELRQQVEVMADEAEAIKRNLSRPSIDPVYTSSPAIRCMADVEPKPVNWLWRNRIAAGRITLAVGMPGVGKSFFTCDLASRVSRGSDFPDGAFCDPGSVVLITAEDDPHDTIRPRFDACGADVSKIHLLSGVLCRDENNGEERELTFSLADADILRQTLQRIHDCRLVIIDPIGSFLGGRTDAHRDNEVRSVLAPIAKLAEEFGPAVLMVAHRRKSQSSIADDTALGSRAFTGIARSVWHLSRDSENPERRLLLPGKSNLAAAQDGLAFTISGNPAQVVYESDPVPMTADDALSAENDSRSKKKPGPNPEAVDACEKWLTRSLANGPREAITVKDEWKNGQDGSEATLKRAKQNLGVESFRDEIPGPWKWRLPKETNPPKKKEPEHLEPLGQNTGKTALLGTDESKGIKLSEPEHLESGDEFDWGEV